MLLGLIVAILSAQFGGAAGEVFDIACVFLVFPIIVYLGAGAMERRPWIGKALGDVSYAAYSIHWPLMVIAATGLRALDVAISAVVQIAVTTLICIVAHAVHRYIDEPVRARLSLLHRGIMTRTVRLEVSGT